MALAIGAVCITVVGVWGIYRYNERVRDRAEAWRILEAEMSTFGNPENVAETKRRGETIIAALAAYMAANGWYPATLGELCPPFLEEIPLPTAGKPEWEYGASADGRFGLTFGIEMYGEGCLYPCYSWIAEESKWYEDN